MDETVWHRYLASHLQCQLLKGSAVDAVGLLRCQQQRLRLRQRCALPGLLPLKARQLHLRMRRLVCAIDAPCSSGHSLGKLQAAGNGPSLST